MNKGFTLTELLVVIVILASLVLIASPVVNSLSSRSKTKLLNDKIIQGEKATINWANDNIVCFHSNSACGFEIDSVETYRTLYITLDKLAKEEYFSYDNKVSGNILDPSDANKCMNNYEYKVTLNIVTKKAESEVASTDGSCK